MSHPNTTSSISSFFPQYQQPSRPAMSSANQSALPGVITLLPATQPTMGGTAHMADGSGEKRRKSIVCDECDLFVGDFDAVISHVNQVHLKMAGRDYTPATTGRSRPYKARKRRPRATTKPTARNPPNPASSSTRTQQHVPHTQLPTRPPTYRRIIKKSPSPHTHSASSSLSSLHLDLPSSFAAPPNPIPEVYHPIGADANAPVYYGNAYDQVSMGAHGPIASGLGSRMDNSFGTAMGIGTMANSTARGTWAPEPMTEIRNWRAAAPTEVYLSDGTLAPGVRMVAPTMAYGTSGSAMPWSAPPPRAHQSSSSSRRAGAESAVPTPPEPTKKASPKRPKVEEEDVKVVPQEFHCESPGCRKVYKTSYGLRKHMERNVCIPAASPASYRPARAIKTEPQAPQQLFHHHHQPVEPPRHPAAPVQRIASVPAVAPHYQPHQWHSGHSAGQNPSTDAHAMASLQQYQQQWHGDMPQTRMQPHQYRQEFQVQDTPVSWSAPPHELIAEFHDQWAYQSTPIDHAPAHTFAAPVMSQHGGPSIDFFSLAAANANAMAQPAQHEEWQRPMWRM